jgi:hypothetical protein
MLLWSFAAASSLGLVLVWLLLEWRFTVDSGGRTPPKPELRNIAGKLALFLALTVAIHAAVDPDHDQHTFRVHGPEIARALYAFTVTLGLLVAFPTLRISAGAGAMGLAVILMEVLQMTRVLPGQFRWIDFTSALLGVAAAAGPMWLGARRAREAMARERAARGG